MSERADIDEPRYAEVSARNVALPRMLAILVVLGGLIVIGYVADGIRQRFIAPNEVPDRSPANQIMVGAPSAFAMPQDTPATAPAAPSPAAKPAPEPTKTVAQEIAQQTGMTQKPDFLQLPDKDWDKIGTVIPGRSGPPQLTDAEKAAVAFGGKVHAPELEGSRATALAPHDLLKTIRPGTHLYCTTQEAIDTTTGAGTFVCDVDNWVPAWDGMTPLIPPHSWVLVRYEELKNGRNRVFAASGILTTPDGGVVSLGDPFSMPDGSAGVEGVIQDNTWARLKEGLILDFAQSAFQTAENLAQRQNQGNNSSSLNFSMSTNNTQNAVDAALAKNMNIPDVLRLAQGSHLSMTIMHPVFFQDAIGFTMRGNHR